jgi:hypothetical protein
MADSRILITGSEYSATRWLTAMFRHNATTESKNIHHELLRERPARLLREWKTPGIHIVVCQSMGWLPELHERFPDMQVAFVLRDPVDNALSIAANYHGKNSPAQALFQGSMRWGLLEQSMRTAERLKIKTSVWHFDYYTTLNGFIEMARHLGVPLIGKPKYLDNKSKTGDRKIQREELPVFIVSTFDKVFAEHEYLARAYDEAKSYAYSKLNPRKEMKNEISLV